MVGLDLLSDEDRAQIGATAPQQGDCAVCLAPDETRYNYDRGRLKNRKQGLNVERAGFRIQNGSLGAQAEANFVERNGGYSRPRQR